MNAVSALQIYVVPEQFVRALKSLRVVVREMELDIVGEIQLADTARGAEGHPTQNKVILVSCPILEFEAVALGRSAAVFFPLHVLVSDERDQTRVSFVNPAGLYDGRFPVGATDPMDRLVARVAMALDCLLQRRQAHH